MYLRPKSLIQTHSQREGGEQDIYIHTHIKREKGGERKGDERERQPEQQKRL